MVLCNLFSCVVVVVVFFLFLFRIELPAVYIYEQVFFFGLLTDQKLISSQRKLYTKQTIYPLKGDVSRNL